jgi:hypothetical protein
MVEVSALNQLLVDDGSSEEDTEVPPIVQLGDVVKLKTSITGRGGPIIEETHIVELYGMCALKDPNGNVIHSEESVPFENFIKTEGEYCAGSYTSGGVTVGTDCSAYTEYTYLCGIGWWTDVGKWKFDKEGIWEFALSVGYIDKKWDYDAKEWVIEEGISDSKTYDIRVSGEIPEPPETSQELLKKLFDMFLNSF